jgi:hypothetical protein
MQKKLPERKTQLSGHFWSLISDLKRQQAEDRI